MPQATVDRAVLYARVSTDMQAEEGKSIAAQLSEMREFAAARGWIIVTEFVDPGFTGTDTDRPGLQALLAAAEEGAFDILLVHELSRLSRRIFDTFRIFEQLGKLGVGFASVKEPDFDFSTPTGRLFLTIMAALNQYYVDLLKMHTAKSKRQRAREGLYNASITPYGYRHVGDSETPPEVVAEEMRVILRMYERYAAGIYSYDEVADWISDQGYCARSGRRFCKDTVADVLRNPFYKGCVVYRAGHRIQDAGEVFPGKHEAIVSEELWERCRRVREERYGAPRTFQPKHRVYLLNGIATCDVCGRKLRAQGAESGQYYREMSAHRGFRDCPCARMGVRVEVVDEQVGEVFRRLRLPEDWQAELARLIEEGDDEREMVEKRRARLVAERRRLKLMKIRGEFDEDLIVYDREQARIRRQLDDLPTTADLGAIEEAADMLEGMAEVWDEAEMVERRDLLRMALREARVDVSQGRLMALEPHPVFVPLFRRVATLREVSFGVFVPLWTPEMVEEIETLATLPPLLEVPACEESPAWPLVHSLPEEIVGQRITPVLSAWLKEQRKEGLDAGQVAELTRPGAPPLRVDNRKWPEVEVERVNDVGVLADESVSFLWTPFALQGADDREALVEGVRRALAPGGTWAFVDVVPASMPGHWLYRCFPQAWDDGQARTWDTFTMYNVIQAAGFEVRLARRTVHRSVEVAVARQVASDREACPWLAELPDEVYAARIAALEQVGSGNGATTLLGSEVCLVEVTARRDGSEGPAG